jgi:hypothetical protein
MLIDRAKELKEQIDKFGRLKSAADEAKTYDTRAKQLNDAASALSNAVLQLKALRDCGIVVDFVPANAIALMEKASVLRTDFSADPKSIGKTTINLKYEFLDRVLAIADAINESIGEAWQAHVESKSHTVPETVVAALATIPTYRMAANRIRSSRAKIIELSSSPPNDVKAALLRLNEFVSEHRTAWEELTAGGIPADVVTFLQACATSGASLAMLNDTVRAWLEHRKLTDAFRIWASVR